MANPEKKPEKQYGLMTAEVLSVALEMGFIIALPIIGLGLIGKHFDTVHHIHIFIYVAIVLALTISVVWLYQRFDSFVRKLKAASDNKSQKKSEKDQDHAN